MQVQSIYFYVLPIENGGYQHNLISLAQGFLELGIPFAASNNYWKQADGSFLFQHDPIEKASEFDLVIISEQYMTYGDGEFPKGFFELPGKKVYIHTGDGLRHQYNLHKLKDFYAQFDVVLMHLYRGIPYPDHFHPWAYGISQHMIDLAQPNLPKSDKICLNYRNSHSVRRLASDRIFDRLPPEMLDTTREMDDWQSWEDSEDYAKYCVYQSAGRHSLAYNHRIGSSLATACFGGVFFLRPWMWNWPAFKVANYFVQSAASVGRMQSFANSLGMAREHVYRIYQWDSWRFWETFANGSAAVHVDLDQYGVILPEMPIVGKHYIGVDLKGPEDAMRQLQDVEKMQEVALEGRKWAMKHYDPVEQAGRLLQLL